MVLGGDGGPLAGEDGFAQGQADAIAGGPGVLAPVEAFKEEGQVLRGDALAAVVEDELGLEQGVLAGDVEGPVLPGLFHAVFQHIPQGLRQPGLVPQDLYS